MIELYSEKAIAHDMGIWEAMVSLSLRITDFEIRLADKCFRGSKAILAARSPYFEAMISSGMREHESGTAVAGFSLPIESNA
jgi:hypothetical protein